MKSVTAITISLFLASCGHKHEEQSFPTFQASDTDWSTYEGTIISEDSVPVEVEISLKEAAVGLESNYRLTAVHSDDNTFASVVLQGKYIVTTGLEHQSFGLQIILNEMDGQIAGLSYLKQIPKLKTTARAKPKNFVLRDLYFSTSGDNRLFQTDDEFRPIASDSRYTIYKRSRVFTVEGYVTINANDSSEFFERNTREEWLIAPFGEYKKIKDGYKKIATEINEGVYLRALAYSITETNDENETYQKLVFKRIVTLGKRGE